MSGKTLEELNRFNPKVVYVIYRGGLPYLNEFGGLEVAKSEAKALSKIAFIKRRNFGYGEFTAEKYVKEDWK